MQHLEKYKQVFGLFLNQIPNDEIILSWFLTDSSDLQDFVVSHLKEDLIWSTGIGIIEATQKIVQEAMYNGNL